MKPTQQTTLPRDERSKLYTPEIQELNFDLGGADNESKSEQNLLLEFDFGENSSKAHTSAINIPLSPIDAENYVERWLYSGPVSYDHSGDVIRARCADFIVFATQLEYENCIEVRKATHAAYKQILDSLSDHPEFQLARMWNYLGDINAGDENQERYRQFSIGRAEAFQDAGIDDQETPAGTCIGTPENTGLTVVGLASRNKFVPVENPLQVSAYDYPPQYGPKSPKFTRSGFVRNSKGALLLVSGTAAVVGHESLFPYQTEPQTEVMLKNLKTLTQEAGTRENGMEINDFDRNSCLKVYLRDIADYPRVRDLLSNTLAIPQSRVAYLQGDICRRELMVEIEGSMVV